MRLLKLIDVEVPIPDEVTVAEKKPEGGVLFYGLSGRAASNMRAQIEAMALERGYELQRSPHASHLLRGSQRFSMLASDPLRLDITVNDDAALPFASTDERGIVLGRLSVPITAERVVPQREWHDDGSESWRAEWQVHGREARDLSSEIHDHLLRQGLRSYGIWDPPEGGIQRWHIEASSPRRLVKVYVTPVESYVVLSITMIDQVGGAADR